MRKTWNVMLAAIICAGLQSGCGGADETPSRPTGPKGVALAMMRAMSEGDGTTVAGYYYCSAEDKEYMIKTMPLLATINKLVTAGTTAYGANAWEAARAKANIGMMVIPNMDNALKNMQCKITGNQALCTLEGVGAWALVQNGANWLIVPQPAQLPLLHMRGEELKARSKAQTAIEAIIPLVGTKNVSADDICAKFNAIIKPK